MITPSVFFFISNPRLFIFCFISCHPESLHAVLSFLSFWYLVVVTLFIYSLTKKKDKPKTIKKLEVSASTRSFARLLELLTCTPSSKLSGQAGT